MIWPAIAIASSTSARKTQSWNATWWAPIEASPNRVATAPARTKEAMRAVVLMKIHFPSERTRRASASRSTSSVRLSPRTISDEERRAHAELRERRAPRRALDSPVEPVDEDHLEHDVDRIRDDEDDERRPEVGDPPQVPLAAEREECGR